MKRKNELSSTLPRTPRGSVVRKPSKEQLRKAGVICAKIAVGDYWGAAQDLSYNSTIISRLTHLDSEAEANDS